MHFCEYHVQSFRTSSPRTSRHYRLAHLAQALASSVQHIQLHSHLPRPPSVLVWGSNAGPPSRNQSHVRQKLRPASNGPPKACKACATWSSFARIVAGTDRRAFALSTSTGYMENSVVLRAGDDTHCPMLDGGERGVRRLRF